MNTTTDHLEGITVESDDDTVVPAPDGADDDTVVPVIPDRADDTVVPVIPDRADDDTVVVPAPDRADDDTVVVPGPMDPPDAGGSSNDWDVYYLNYVCLVLVMICFQ